MKILVTGSRHWVDASLIRAELTKQMSNAMTEGNGEFILIHGAAPGADTLAEMAMLGFGLRLKIKGYPADWKTHGNAAGPIRNKQMLDENPDIQLVLAFTDDPPGKPRSGTWNMVGQALERGIPVRIWSHRRAER